MCLNDSILVCCACEWSELAVRSSKKFTDNSECIEFSKITSYRQ